MEDKLLTSIVEVIELTGFDGSIDNDTLRPFTIMAQNNETKRILGTELYNKIVNDRYNEVLTGLYLDIYNEYIAPIQCYYTASYYLQLGVAKVSQNGVYLVTPEKTEQIFDDKTQKMADKYEKLAISLEYKLVEYLNTANLPEWTSPDQTKAKTSFNWIKV